MRTFKFVHTEEPIWVYLALIIGMIALLNVTKKRGMRRRYLKKTKVNQRAGLHMKNLFKTQLLHFFQCYSKKKRS